MPRASYDPGAFLGLAGAACQYATARARVLPVAYEASVSYGAGAAKGPSAILAASRQVELYDRAYGGEPALAYGAHSLPAVVFGKKETGAPAMARIRKAAREAWVPDRLLLALGGEHTITAGLFAGVADRCGQPLTVVHVDAHADLRDRYEGSPYSHACAIRRVAEHPGCAGLIQLGIRSLCAEEAEWIGHPPLPSRTWFAEDMREGAGACARRRPRRHPPGAAAEGRRQSGSGRGNPASVPAWAAATWEKSLALAVRGRLVYFTLDIDAMDPSEMPGTGTPEPDGLRWRDAIRIADIVSRESSGVAALDIVETAPIKGTQATEFAVAKLAYGLLSRFILGAPGR